MSGQKKVSGWAVLMCLILALPLIVSSTAWAEKIQPYSADQYVIHNGKEQKVGSIYVSKDKMRMEHSMPGEMEQMVIITRQDKKLTWTVFPEKKKYIESSLTEENMKMSAAFGSPANMKVKTSEESLGFETISGYKCEKKRISSTMDMMGTQVTSRSTIWMSEDLNFPIRTEAEGGEITELRNIKEGSQKDSLFEIPSGLTKAADIMEVMNEGVQDEEDSEEEAQPAMPQEMPEEMRKMIEEQMGKHGR
jgi:hypothetical protein